MVVVFHFAFALVDNSLYVLDFVNENYYFDMSGLVYVVAYVVLVYMVQKYLVDLRDKSGVFRFENFIDGFDRKNGHHLMRDNFVYNKVFFVYFGFDVYCFYAVEKMGNFQLGLLKFVGYHQNLLSLMLVVGNSVVVKINDFVGLYEEV